MNTKKLFLTPFLIVTLFCFSSLHTMNTEFDPNIYTNPEAVFVVFEKAYGYFFPTTQQSTTTEECGKAAQKYKIDTLYPEISAVINKMYK